MKPLASNMILVGCLLLVSGLSALRESSLERACKQMSSHPEVLERAGGFEQTMRLLRERAPRTFDPDTKFLELRCKRFELRNKCLLLSGGFVLAGLVAHRLLTWEQRRRFGRAA